MRKMSLRPARLSEKSVTAAGEMTVGELERRHKASIKPEALHITGSLSGGIDAERMRAIAAEFEEREAKRLEQSGIRVRKKPEQEEEEIMSREKEARPIPEVIDSRWPWMARRAEMEQVLKERFGVTEDLEDLNLDELRRMVNEKRDGGTHKVGRPSRKTTGPRVARVKKAIREDIARKRAEARPQENNGSGQQTQEIKFPCLICGQQHIIRLCGGRLKGVEVL